MKKAPEPEPEHDEWVIATWHIFHGAQLMFVAAREDKPFVEGHTTSAHYQAFKWNSYHAARKFQKAHAKLDGYIVCNLSEMRRQAAAVKTIEIKSRLAAISAKGSDS